MAIKYNNTAVTNVNYNSQTVKKIVLDGEVKWEKPFTLSANLATGSSASYSRTSTNEPSASTGTITTSSTIYNEDVIKITVTPTTNYEIASLTVNGSAYTSGSAYTVTGNVAVVCTTIGVARTIGVTVGTGVSSITVTYSNINGVSTTTTFNSTGNITNAWRGTTYTWTATYATGYEGTTSGTGTVGDSNTIAPTASLIPYTITWKYLTAYPDTWGTTQQTYHYNDTPSRSNAATVTNSGSTERKVFASWNNLNKVTANRTITATYTQQYNVTISSVRCSAKVDGVVTTGGWYNDGKTITWTSNTNCAFNAAGTQTATTDTIDAATTYSATAGYVNVTALTGTHCTATTGSTGWQAYNTQITWTADAAYAFNTSNAETVQTGAKPGVNTCEAPYVKRYTLTINVTNPSYGTCSVSRTSSPIAEVATGALSNGDYIYYGDVLAGSASGNGVSYGGWNITSVTAPTFTTTGNATSGNLTVTNKDSHSANLYYNTTNATGGTLIASGVATNATATQTGLAFNTTYYISARVDRSRTKHTDATDGSQYSGTSSVTGAVTAAFKFKRTDTTDSGTLYSSVVTAKTAAQTSYTITFTRQRKDASSLQSLGSATTDTSIGVASVTVPYGGSYSETFSKTNYVSQTKSGSNITADATVTVTLEPKTYSLSASLTNWSGGWYANNAYSGSTISWMYHGGGTAYFRATPNSRYEQTISSTRYYNGQYYTTTASNANGSVTLNATAIAYTVTSSLSNAVVTLGTSTSSYSSSLSKTYAKLYTSNPKIYFKITPNSHCGMTVNSTWYYNGNPLSGSSYYINGNSFTFSDANKTATYALSATTYAVSAITYTATVSANNSTCMLGTVSGTYNNSIELAYQSKTIYLWQAPSQHYEVTYGSTRYYYGNNYTTSVNYTSFTFNDANKTAAYSMTACSATTYSWTVTSSNSNYCYFMESSSTSGTPTTDTAISKTYANMGAYLVYKINANDYYYCNSSSYPKGTPYTSYIAKGSCTFSYANKTATYAKNCLSFTYTCKPATVTGGTVSWNPATIVCGQSSIYTITANTGYTRPSTYTATITWANFTKSTSTANGNATASGLANCTPNPYTVTVTKNTGISTIYYRNGTSGSWISTTSSTTFSANYNSTVQYYATAATGYTANSDCGTSSNPKSFTVSTSGNTISPTATLNSYTITFSDPTYGTWNAGNATAYHFDYIAISGNTVTCKAGGSSGSARWTRTLSANAADETYTYSASVTSTSFTVTSAASVNSTSDREYIPYTITWRYLSAYPDTWTETNETYHYNQTPSRTDPGNVTDSAGTSRQRSDAWDSLAKVTSSRTISRTYTKQHYITFTGTRCTPYKANTYSGDTFTTGWYNYSTSAVTVYWKASTNCAFNAAGTTTQTTSTFTPNQAQTVSKSADYIYVTVNAQANTTKNKSTDWHHYGDTRCTYTANSGYAFDSSGTTVKYSDYFTTPGGTYSCPSAITHGYLTVSAGTGCTATGGTTSSGWKALSGNPYSTTFTRTSGYAFDSSGTTTQISSGDVPRVNSASCTHGYYTLSLTNCAYNSDNNAGWYALGTKPATIVKASSGWSFGGSTAQDTTSVGGDTAVPCTKSASPSYFYITVGGNSNTAITKNGTSTTMSSGFYTSSTKPSSITWIPATYYSYTAGATQTSYTENSISSAPATYSHTPTNYKAAAINNSGYASANKDTSIYYASGTYITWTAGSNYSFNGSSTGDATTTGPITAGGTFNAPNPGYVNITVTGTNCSIKVGTTARASGWSGIAAVGTTITYTGNTGTNYKYGWGSGATWADSYATTTQTVALGTTSYSCSSPSIWYNVTITKNTGTASANYSSGYLKNGTTVTFTATTNTDTVRYSYSDSASDTHTKSYTVSSAGQSISSPTVYTWYYVKISATNSTAHKGSASGTAITSGSSAWYISGQTITWTPSTNYSFAEGTSQSNTSATISSASALSKSPSYGYVTVTKTRCSGIDTGYRAIGSTTFTANSNCAYSSDGSTTTEAKTVAAGGSISSSADYIYVTIGGSNNASIVKYGTSTTASTGWYAYNQRLTYNPASYYSYSNGTTQTSKSDVYLTTAGGDYSYSPGYEAAASITTDSYSTKSAHVAGTYYARGTAVTYNTVSTLLAYGLIGSTAIQSDTQTITAGAEISAPDAQYVYIASWTLTRCTSESTLPTGWVSLRNFLMADFDSTADYYGFSVHGSHLTLMTTTRVEFRDLRIAIITPSSKPDPVSISSSGVVSVTAWYNSCFSSHTVNGVSAISPVPPTLGIISTRTFAFIIGDSYTTTANTNYAYNSTGTTTTKTITIDDSNHTKLNNPLDFTPTYVNVTSLSGTNCTARTGSSSSSSAFTTGWKSTSTKIYWHAATNYAFNTTGTGSGGAYKIVTVTAGANSYSATYGKLTATGTHCSVTDPATTYVALSGNPYTVTWTTDTNYAFDSSGTTTATTTSVTVPTSISKSATYLKYTLSLTNCTAKIGTTAVTAGTRYATSGTQITATANTGYAFDNSGTTSGSQTLTTAGQPIAFTAGHIRAILSFECCAASGYVSGANWVTSGTTITATADSKYAFDSSGTTTESIIVTAPTSKTFEPMYGYLCLICTNCTYYSGDNEGWYSRATTHSTTFKANSGYSIDGNDLEDTHPETGFSVPNNVQCTANWLPLKIKTIFNTYTGTSAFSKNMIYIHDGQLFSTLNYSEAILDTTLAIKQGDVLQFTALEVGDSVVNKSGYHCGLSIKKNNSYESQLIYTDPVNSGYYIAYYAVKVINNATGATLKTVNIGFYQTTSSTYTVPSGVKNIYISVQPVQSDYIMSSLRYYNYNNVTIGQSPATNWWSYQFYTEQYCGGGTNYITYSCPLYMRVRTNSYSTGILFTNPYTGEYVNTWTSDDHSGAWRLYGPHNSALITSTERSMYQLTGYADSQGVYEIYGTT